MKKHRIVAPTYATIGRAVSGGNFLLVFEPVSGAQKHGGNARQNRFWQKKM